MDGFGQRGHRVGLETPLSANSGETPMAWPTGQSSPRRWGQPTSLRGGQLDHTGYQWQAQPSPKPCTAAASTGKLLLQLLLPGFPKHPLMALKTPPCEPLSGRLGSSVLCSYHCNKV